MRARRPGLAMLRHLSAPALLAAAVTLGCASPIKTDFDLDPSINIPALATYAWISEKPLIDVQPGAVEGGVSYVSPIDDKRIRQAVNAELQGKGYKLVPLDQAGLVVSFSVGREEKTKVYETPGRSTMIYPGAYGSYRYGGWYSGSSVEVRQYEEGTLTIQFFDRETQHAVWVGWASKRLSKSDDRQEVVNKAVYEILKEFPARK